MKTAAAFITVRQAGDLLRTLQHKPKPKRVACIDLESKAGIDPYDPGFAIPFLVAVAPPIDLVYTRNAKGRKQSAQEVRSTDAVTFRDLPELRSRLELELPRIEQAKNAHLAALKAGKPAPKYTKASPFNRLNPDSLFEANGAYRGNAVAGSAIDGALSHIVQSGWLFTTRERVIIYAHGGGKLDMLHLKQWFVAREDLYEVETIDTGSRMVDMVVSERVRPLSQVEAYQLSRKWGRIKKLYLSAHLKTCEKKTCHGCRPVVAAAVRDAQTEDELFRSPRSWNFRDSVANLTMTLHEACAAFLSEKPDQAKIDFDLNTHLSDPQWDVYCRRDVESLRAVIVEFARQLAELGGTLEMTIGATGMALFRRKYLARSIMRWKHKALIKTKKGAALLRGSHFRGCPAVCQRCLRTVCPPFCSGDWAYAKDELRRAKDIGGAWNKKRADILEKAIASSDSASARPHRSHDAKIYAPQCPTYPMGCCHAWIAGVEMQEPQLPAHTQPALAPTVAQYKAPDVLTALITPETAAAHGARTELHCRLWRKFNLRYLDINSSYPNQLRQPMPVGVPSRYHGLSLTRLVSTTPDLFACMSKLAARRANEDFDPALFVDCDVEVPRECQFPPLGVTREKKFIFPAGRFRGRFAWCELRHLPEVGGRILRVHDVLRYQTFPVLRDFADDLYEQRLLARKEGNIARAETIKLILNSAGFGKFLQSPIRSRFIDLRFDRHRGDLSVDPLGTYGEFGKQSVYSESAFYIPNVGAWITALAREHLWSLFRAVELAGGRVVYSDSDSLLVDPIGAKALEPYVHDTRLGALKDEYATSGKKPYGPFAFEGLAPKEYMLSWRDGRRAVRLKGVSLERVGPHVPDDKKLWELWETTYRAWERGERVALPDQLVRHNAMLRDDGDLRTLQERKKQRSMDRESKRVFLPTVKDKERSAPIVLDEVRNNNNP